LTASALNSSVKRLLVIDPPILNRHYQVSTESGAYQYLVGRIDRITAKPNGLDFMDIHWLSRQIQLASYLGIGSVCFFSGGFIFSRVKESKRPRWSWQALM